MYQYRLGTNVLKNSFATKDLAVLVNKASMNQQCGLAAANAKHNLGHKQQSKQEAEVFIPLYSVIVRPHLKYYVLSGAPQYRHT